MKNGEIIVAIARALYAAPIWIPVDSRYRDMYVLMVTYHDPQMKYSRSIINESLVMTMGFILSGLVFNDYLKKYTGIVGIEKVEGIKLCRGTGIGSKK
jgi:hypothetical protein